MGIRSPQNAVSPKGKMVESDPSARCFRVYFRFFPLAQRRSRHNQFSVNSGKLLTIALSECFE